MKCTKCGNELKEDAKFCTKCGTKLKKEVKMKFCKECGSELNMVTKSCPKCNCGINEEKGRSKVNRILLGMAFCVVVFIVAGGIRFWFDRHPTKKMKEERIRTALAAYEKTIESLRTENKVLSSGHGRFIGASLVNIDDDGIPECVAWFDEYYVAFNHIVLEKYALLLDHDGRSDDEWADELNIGGLSEYSNFKYTPESGGFAYESFDYYKMLPDDDRVRFDGHNCNAYSFSDKERAFERVDYALERNDDEGNLYYEINDENVSYEEFRVYTDNMLSDFSACLSEDDVYDSIWEAYDEFED